jgi:hypothetical protein
MADPIETPKQLYREAERGEDEATPAILVGGMTLLISAIVAVLVAIVLLVYFFA